MAKKEAMPTVHIRMSSSDRKLIERAAKLKQWSFGQYVRNAAAWTANDELKAQRESKVSK